MLVSSGSLGHVELLPGDEMPIPHVIEDFTDVAEYSRFKFGDGEVSKKYGGYFFASKTHFFISHFFKNLAL